MSMSDSDCMRLITSAFVCPFRPSIQQKISQHGDGVQIEISSSVTAIETNDITDVHQQPPLPVDEASVTMSAQQPFDIETD